MTFMEIFQTEQSYWSVNKIKNAETTTTTKTNNFEQKSKLLNWLMIGCNLLKVKLIYLN